MSLKKALEKLYAPTIILLIIYVYFLLRFRMETGVIFFHSGLSASFIFVYSAFSLIFISFFWNYLFSTQPKLNAFFQINGIALYLYFGFYHLRSKTEVDFALIRDNLTIAFSPDSFLIISKTVEPRDHVKVWSITLILIFLEIKYKAMSKPLSPNHKKTKIMIALLGFLALPLGTPYTMDEYSSFLKSIYNYYSQERGDFPKYEEKNLPQFPYLREIKNPEVPGPKPNIILIMIESFNAHYVETKVPETGEEYMPFFNSMIPQGIYVPDFYGNSVQTVKGHFAILCGTLPLMQKKVFVHFPQINFQCLPQVLKNKGYRTIYYQASEDINFDNEFNFLKKNGFETVMENKPTKEEREKYYRGLGVRDDIFYKNVFNYLDGLNGTDNPGKPSFVALATIMNHMMFDFFPQEERMIFKNPKTFKEAYSNSIRAVDIYLKIFFEELAQRKYLENSIVIITGDHSYPTGEHQNIANENFAYTENFKTPFLMIDLRKKITPQRISGIYSQLDIAPTVMALAGLSAPVHFTGESIFRMEKKNTVHLIQPYAGNYLSVIKDNLKYIYHRKTNEEFIFNLKDDPGETKNLFARYREDPVYAEIKKEVGWIYLNEQLIKHDRIWPATK